MKSFKQFLKENSEPVQGQLDKDGYPCVYVDNTRKLKESDNDDNDGIRKYSSWRDVNDNSGIARTMAGVGDNLHAHQGESERDPSNPRHTALFNYTKNSTHLNKTLFSDHLKGRTSSEEITSGLSSNNTQVHHLPTLDNAVEHHKLKDALSVYSGVKFHPGNVAAKHPEGIIHLPAYTSTTIKKDVATDFTEQQDDGHAHIIHFHLPVGQKGAYVGETPRASKNQFTEHTSEHEFVLPRNTKVKIHPVPEIVKYPGSETKIHIWHAHPVEGK